MAVRKDPNKEFFQMILLSYKMNNQESDDIMELDGKGLYHKCALVEKTPFHKFPEWVAHEVQKIRFKKVYYKNKRRLERNKDLMKEVEAMDGTKLNTFNIVEDYV